MDLILYHGHCPDGFCAAYIASKRYSEAKLVPLDHGAEFDFSQVEGKDVLMLDFSLRTREQNDKIASLAKSFRILDHHKSAKEVLEGAPYATFDMNRSGAGLAWDYLFGKDSDVNELAKTHDVSLTWFERGDGVIQFSLRSIGDIDVSQIAKKFNGGGHKNASGFQLPLGKGREIVDTILNRSVITVMSQGGS